MDNTAAQKAKELVEKFRTNVMIGIVQDTFKPARQAALIAIELEIDLLSELLYRGNNDDRYLMSVRGELIQIKSEIEKL